MTYSDVARYMGLMVLPSIEEPQEEKQNKELGEIAKPRDRRTKGISTIQEAVSISEVDPIRALEYLDEVLRRGNLLSASDHFDALLGRARIHFLQGTPSALRVALGDLERAKKCLSNPKDLEEVPWKTAEVSKYMAMIYIQHQNYRAAKAQFEEGWQACKAHRELAFYYIQFVQEHEKNYEGALAVCEEALRGDSKSIDLLYTRAKIAVLAKRWQQALEACSRCLETGQMSRFRQVEILDCAALSSCQLELYQPALKYLEEANLLEGSLKESILRSKKILRVRLALAPLSAFKGNYADQIKAVQQDPNGAFEIFDSLVPLYAKTEGLGGVVLCRAVACIEGNQPERFASARENLREVEALGVNPSLVFEWRARLCIKERKFDEAMTNFKEMWKLSNKMSMDGKVYLPEDRKDWDWALELCEEALLRTKDVNAYYARAKIRFYQEEWRGCRIDCAAFLSHRPKGDVQLEILDLAAEACIKMGDDPYEYRLAAYIADKSIGVIERFKKLLEEHPTKKPSITHIYNVIEENNSETDLSENLILCDFILTHAYTLSERRLIQVYISRARACIYCGGPEKLLSARQSLARASELLGSYYSWEHEAKAEIFGCYGLINIKENNPDEALLHFKEGWKLSRCWKLRVDYSNFLIEQKDLKGALKICREGSENESEWKWRQCSIYTAAQKWAEAIDLYDSLLKAVGVDGKRLALEYAIEIPQKIHDYRKGREYAAMGCKVAQPCSLIWWLNMLFEMNKGCLVDEHLEKICQSVPDRLELLTLLIETYQQELPKHPRHHFSLLRRRGQIYEKQGDILLALYDFDSALKIIRSYPWICDKKTRSDLEKRIGQLTEEVVILESHHS